jgi:glycosyltransferase involved in cell wall biosynthesis
LTSFVEQLADRFLINNLAEFRKHRHQLEARRRILQKIVYLTDSTEHGGAEDHLRVLVGEFHKRGQEVKVLFPKVPETLTLIAQFEVVGIQVAPLPLIPIHPGAIRQTRKAVSLNIVNLYRCFRRIKPDLLHFVMSWPTRDNWCGMIAALLLRIPYVVDFQLVPPLIHCAPTNRGMLKYLGRVLRFVFSRADAVICVSNGNRKRLARLFDLDEKRITVVQNCVETGLFENINSGALCGLRAELGLLANDLVITTVARLSIQKGHQYLIEAARRVCATFPELRFLLVGEGELREELTKRVEVAGLPENFVFAGYRRDVPEILALTDIFVLPTLFEGLPHSILEAMAAGKCVVASRVDGVDEVVVDKETGLLVEAGDVSQLADALDLLIRNRTAREDMGRKGKKRVIQLFGLNNMIERFASIYERVSAT